MSTSAPLEIRAGSKSATSWAIGKLKVWSAASGSGAGDASPEARARALADRVLAVFADRRAGVRWPEALRRPAAQSLGTRLVGGAPSRTSVQGNGVRNGRARGTPLRRLPEPRPVGGGEGRFKAAVRRALEYIRAGDVFQVVLSQRFELPDCDGFSLYRTLRAASPAPYHFYLRLGGRELFGASPELLVQVDRGEMTVRPIAGTRPRGTTLQQDRALESELLADEKERAEHLMLLDLGRNDVGRVARTATVKVTDQFSVERFSQVMHIVSNVEGQLDGRYDALDALAAGFPAGTVSGAPKVRAMEIIDELEPDKRGLYAGSVGYFSAAGELDSCIVLRTALIKDGMMYVQAGAGIVADSNPKFEQQECVDKAKALFRAAEEAKRFASAARRGQ